VRTPPRTPRITLRLGRIAAVAAATATALAFGLPARANVSLTEVSTDPYTNTTSYHQTQVEPDTFASGNTIVSAFQTGRFTDGGSSNVGWATSVDAGATWTNGFLPKTTVYATPPGRYARVTDPSVAFDAEHGVWLIASLALNGSNVKGVAIIVSRSVDGGITWGNPVVVSRASGGADYDKDWIVCDDTPSSPNYGNCYTEWDDFGHNNRIKMSVSTNGGQTWTASTLPSTSVIGGVPQVQPNGTVIVPIANGFESKMLSFVSTNGGASYSGPFTVSTIKQHGVAGGMRSDALPTSAVDAAGTVYVAWQDCRFRTGCTSNDIVYSTSTDGQTWSAVTRVPIDDVSSTIDHFIPGLDVQPGTSGGTAQLGLYYYYYPTAGCTASTCQLDVGFTSSPDGGGSWTAPVQVTGPMTLSWLPNASGRMVGDYISTSYVGTKAYSVFAVATAGTCQLGNITSCHESMNVPTGGLIPVGALRPAGLDRPAPGVRSHVVHTGLVAIR
jgi:hypothetical protein